MAIQRITNVEMRAAAQDFVRGADAIHAAIAGAPLFVFNEQKGWIPAGAGGLERACKALNLSVSSGSTHALYCYGVERSAHPIPHIRAERSRRPDPRSAARLRIGAGPVKATTLCGGEVTSWDWQRSDVAKATPAEMDEFRVCAKCRAIAKAGG